MVGNAGKSAKALAVGDAHTCALLTTGSVACWGYNGYGQLGNGDAVTVGTSPTHMGANLREVQLMPGALHKRILRMERLTCTTEFGLAIDLSNILLIRVQHTCIQ